MRRTIAAAALAVGLLAAAGCSGDDGGSQESSGSVQAVCSDIQATVEPLDPELNQALNEAGMAAASEDEEQYDQAKAALDDVVAEIAEHLRAGADRADDADFAEALRGLAEAVEALADIALGGDLPEGDGFAQAGSRVQEYCDPSEE